MATETTTIKPASSRVPLLDPAIMLLKSRSFVSALLLLGLSILGAKIPEFAAFRDEIFAVCMGIIALVFFKNTSMDVAQTISAAKDKATSRPITDRTAMTQDIYDELTSLMHDVMFTEATANTDEVKQAVAQSVAVAEAKQVARELKV